MQRTGKSWSLREDLRPQLEKAKKLFPTILGHIETERIALCGFRSRTSDANAKIHANRPPWSIYSEEYDYVIAFWENYLDRASPEKIFRTVVHELMHVLPQGHIPHTKQYRKCLKHDLEDFMFLRRVYGLEHENLKNIFKGEKYIVEVSKDETFRFPRTRR
mgnify:FL=1